MNSIKIVLISLCLLLSKVKNEEQIDVWSNGAFLFKWTILEDTQEITITLDSSYGGYIGWGISPTGKMGNSDCMIGYIENGSPVAKDLWCLSDDVETDSQYDFTNVTGSLTDGRQIITYTRKLNTGDSKDLAIVQGESQYLIFAYHTSVTTNVEHDRDKVVKATLYPASTTSTTTDSTTSSADTTSTTSTDSTSTTTDTTSTTSTDSTSTTTDTTSNTSTDSTSTTTDKSTTTTNTGTTVPVTTVENNSDSEDESDEYENYTNNSKLVSIGCSLLINLLIFNLM